MDIRMRQLTRAQFALSKLLITAFIAADLFAFWVWATWPPRIYSGLLGLGDIRSEAPFLRIANWANWHDGPRTPSGFVLLFDPGELVFCAVLLLALVLMILFLFAPREADTPMWRRSSPKFGALQFRMGIALALIAIIGVYLGWEVHAWRTWESAVITSVGPTRLRLPWKATCPHCGHYGTSALTSTVQRERMNRHAGFAFVRRPRLRAASRPKT